MQIPPKNFQTIFSKKVQMSEDAYSFYFQRPSDLAFQPGQYMRIDIEIPNPDVRGNSRLFTIASSPTKMDHLMITTRIIQSSFKKTLFNMTPGTKVSIVAPYGVFILHEEETIPHVFLAGGIGITPFHSMITYAAHKNLNIPITLFTSFQTVEHIVFRDELLEIAKNHSWLKLIETVTKPEESKTPWSGHTGRIDEEFIKENVPDLQNSLFYISGPPAMVDALKEITLKATVPEAHIRTEKFTGY